jgi:hypothetical protein
LHFFFSHGSQGLNHFSLLVANRNIKSSSDSLLCWRRQHPLIFHRPKSGTRFIKNDGNIKMEQSFMHHRIPQK